MTLPFRRRHHDDETAHDRARAIVATSLLEPVPDEDEAWLETHLAHCGECARDRAAYLADRARLRTLREDPPPPPRDLWARTAAAIERESGRGGMFRRTRGRSRALAGPATPAPAYARGARARIGAIPLGAMSGALVLLVVVAVSLVPRMAPPIAEASPARTDTAVASPAVPVATPLAVEAGLVGWMRPAGDGKVELVLANVDSVCTDPAGGCAPLSDATAASITLAAPPQSVAISPASDQLIVVPGPDTDASGTVLLVPVPTPTPAATASGSAGPDTPAPATSTPGATADGTPAGSTGPTPFPTPEGSRAIATGVVVVGDGAYSPDGRWFAFSARPIDGSAGPDLYLWTAGTDLAVKVSDDGATYFSGWAGDRILASRVSAVAPEPDASASAPASASPGAPSGKPSPSPTPKAIASPSPSPSVADASASPDASPAGPVVGRATSFLLDPVTLARIDLAIADVWMPTVDPTNRFAVYWSGTLRLDDATGLWVPDRGRLVLDGWNAPLSDPLADPSASAPASDGPDASATVEPASPSAEPSADASLGPTAPPVVGPAGTPVDLVTDPIAAFDAHFDPTGTRLAIWTPGESGGAVGVLRLVVLDPVAGATVPGLDPLGGVPALRGFSIAAGRLAWVTPPGQDGEESRVSVLGWSNDDFGQVNSDASKRLVIVR